MPTVVFAVVDLCRALYLWNKVESQKDTHFQQDKRCPYSSISIVFFHEEENDNGGDKKYSRKVNENGGVSGVIEGINLDFSCQKG